MKTAFVVLSSLAVAMAQAPASLGSCGQTCINDMLQIAVSQFGCASGNATCYCENPDFGYGIRDCANEACNTAAPAIISYGSSYCQSALATVSGASQTASGLGSMTAGSGSGSGSGSLTTMAITTSDLVETTSSGGSEITSTTGSTTIYTTALITGSGSSNGSETSSGSGSMSSGASGANGSSGSGSSGSGSMGATTTGPAGSASGAGSGGASSSSKAGGAVITAAPVMGLAAGAAALMML